MKRWNLGCLLAAVVALSACGGGSTLPTPEPRAEEDALREDIERLLELRDVEGVLAARSRAFTRRVAIMMGDPSDSELERLVPAVVDAFAYDSLYADVVAYMSQEGTPELAASALEWMEDGATAAVRRIGEEYEPAQTLEEYSNEMTDELPSEERVHLISDWVEARGEGEFFVLMQEALREAAFRVRRAFRPDAPTFEPLSGEELEMARVNSHGASVIRLMHGYAPAPDQLIRRVTAEYESEAGRWFTEAYAMGVASAIRAAGERATRRLSGRDGR
ncbi:MAG: hypothetical protein U5R14_06595 [Gemmatimonadota bacterium]|nr:hypothetical protein [Gemmatimonadota bacterium]